MNFRTDTSAAYLKQLNSMCKIKFINATSPNDLTDGVCNEKHNIGILFPNSEREDIDNELFNKFRFLPNFDEGESEEDLFFTTLEEAVYHIHKSIK